MRWMVAVAFAVTLGWAAVAHAGNVRVGFGAPVPSRGVVVQDRGLEVFGERRVTVVQSPTLSPGCTVVNGQYLCGPKPPGVPQHCYGVTGNWLCGGTPPPHKPFGAGGHYPIAGPGYVSPSCYVAGYWTTQWVPQQSLYTVWIDGYWAADGSWVDGRYEQRPYVSGYAQQSVWVPERWAC